MDTPKKRTFTIEHRMKLRMAKLGKPSGFKGKKRSKPSPLKGRKRSKPSPLKGRTGFIPSEETRKKMSISQTGKRVGVENWQWKGDKCTYRSLHEWVQRLKGSPNKCEACGKSEENKRNMHWSNISGEYKRDLSDYRRLCMLCHRRNDKRLSGFKKHFNPDKTRKLVTN